MQTKIPLVQTVSAREASCSSRLKFLKRLLKRQVVDHLTRFEVLVPKQFGFQSTRFREKTWSHCLRTIRRFTLPNLPRIKQLRFQRQHDSMHLQLENRNQRFQVSRDAVFQEPKADGIAFADWQNELAMVQRSEVPRRFILIVGLAGKPKPQRCPSG